ncbi:MAG TPA: carboxymuconolactone decarboxylase family protein [Gammaproteobacteria bacterium]|nr:carboxymuconolactone decarboxylase family protein [Gammaproteobacteria bacterium]
MFELAHTKPASGTRTSAVEARGGGGIVVAVLMLIAALGSALAPGAPLTAQPVQRAAGGSTIDAESGSRLPLLARKDMRDEAAAQIYATLAGPGGEPPHGTTAIALYSPGTAAALGRIHAYLRTESALGPRQFELLGLITAREMNLAYEWAVHERAAAQAGLPTAVVEVVRRNAPVTGLASLDALLIDFGRQLFRNRGVDSATFAAVLQRLGRQQTFDVIMALAYPAMAGILQRAVDQRPPPGFDPAALPAVAGVGTPTGRPGEFVELGPRPPVAPDVHEDSYYRLPLLRREELDPRGREIFDRLVGSDRTTAPRGPVGMTLNSPQLADPVQQLNDLLRIRGALDRRLAEIVVATTGREMNSQYQWIVHGAAAAQAGAEQPVLEAIRVDADLSGLAERDAVAIAFTRELFREPAVRADTFAAALRLFGARGTVELAALAGDYLMMTTVYNALGMRLRADQNPTLPHRAGAPVGAEWR